MIFLFWFISFLEYQKFDRCAWTFYGWLYICNFRGIRFSIRPQGASCPLCLYSFWVRFRKAEFRVTWPCYDLFLNRKPKKIDTMRSRLSVCHGKCRVTKESRPVNLFTGYCYLCFERSRCKSCQTSIFERTIACNTRNYKISFSQWNKFSLNFSSFGERRKILIRSLS